MVSNMKVDRLAFNQQQQPQQQPWQNHFLEQIAKSISQMQKTIPKGLVKRWKSKEELIEACRRESFPKMICSENGEDDELQVEEECFQVADPLLQSPSTDSSDSETRIYDELNCSKVNKSCSSSSSSSSSSTSTSSSAWDVAAPSTTQTTAEVTTTSPLNSYKAKRDKFKAQGCTRQLSLDSGTRERRSSVVLPTIPEVSSPHPLVADREPADQDQLEGLGEAVETEAEAEDDEFPSFTRPRTSTQ